MAQSFRQMVGAKPSTASPSDSVLIIIDAQNEYAEGHLKVTNASSTRKAIAALLQKYRTAGGKVVHVKHIVPDGTPVFTPNTMLADEFEELTPKDGEKVIEKQHPSSFADTLLHDYLQSINASKVVLTGYMVCLKPQVHGGKMCGLMRGTQAHVCVSTTARDAARFGYDTIVAEDCVGDRDIPGASGEEVTKMVMHELADFFGTVLQSSEIK